VGGGRPLVGRPGGDFVAALTLLADGMLGGLLALLLWHGWHEGRVLEGFLSSRRPCPERPAGRRSPRSQAPRPTGRRPHPRLT
jgi:hypothetical protein